MGTQGYTTATGGRVTRTSFYKVSGLPSDRVKSISHGHWHTCVVMESDGSVYCWWVEAVAAADTMPGSKHVCSSRSSCHCGCVVLTGCRCALRTCSCFRGDNRSGAIGIGPLTDTSKQYVSTATRVTGLSGAATQMSCGNSFSCALMATTGQVYCCECSGRLQRTCSSQSTVSCRELLQQCHINRNCSTNSHSGVLCCADCVAASLLPQGV